MGNTATDIYNKATQLIGKDAVSFLSPLATEIETNKANSAREDERNAAKREAVVRESAERAAAASQEAARQASRQQEDAAKRQAAEGAATDALNKPMENPDINLTGAPTESAAGASRKKRQAFGVGSANTGVNI